MSAEAECAHPPAAIDPQFLRSEAWNARFWDRFGGAPEIAGKLCMDLGAGVGSFSVDLASRGAYVHAVEPDTYSIAKGTRSIAARDPSALRAITFVPRTLPECDYDSTFDFIFSRDTFEHILDLPATLAAAYKALKPGGRLYSGFGPLYYSPFGDHGALQLRVPWVHGLFANAIRRGTSHFIASDKLAFARDKLNLMTSAAFEEAFRASGFRMVSLRYNASRHPAVRVFSALRKLPPLRELCTVSIHVVMEREA